MWWSKARARRVVTLVVLTVLLTSVGGCTLRPLYGGPAGEETARDLAAITVDVPKSRLGAVLRDALIRELGASGLAAEARYALRLQLERQRNALLVQLDDSITRYELILTARYDLVDLTEDRVLLRTASQRVASFNVVRQPYADFAAERDAEERAAIELARAVRNRLALFFAGQQP